MALSPNTMSLRLWEELQLEALGVRLSPCQRPVSWVTAVIS